MEFRILIVSFVFPRRHMAEIFVIPFGFIFLCLVRLVEVAPAGFSPGQRINDHHFPEFKEIGHAAGSLEALVKVFGGSGKYQSTNEGERRGR